MNPTSTGMGKKRGSGDLPSLGSGIGASVLLIHPPVTRPTEPPAGLARLAGFLRSIGVTVEVWDANLEGLLFLMKSQPAAADTWTKRARRDLPGHLSAIRSGKGFENPDTYRRIVGDLQRLVGKSFPSKSGWAITLTDANHPDLSPTSGRNLLRMAENPEMDPFFPFWSPILEGKLESLAPTHVGFSVNYLGQATSAAAMAGFLREVAPRLITIMGGGLITSWMSRPEFRNPLPEFVHHLVSGPGERALPEILGLEPKYDLCNPRDVVPDFSGFPIQEYLSPGFVLPLSLSHGCFWARCSFCPETAEKGGYQAISGDRATSLFSELSTRYRPRLLHFLDNALSPALLKKLAGSPPGIPWYGFSRFIRDFSDPVFCRDIRDSGCRMLQLGLESGDQDVLDSLDKGITLSEASLALRNLHEAGIGTYVYLLFGTPSEERLSAVRTLDFVASHADTVDFLNLAIFNLPMEAASTAALETRPFSEGDLSLYRDFRHPKGWDRKKIRNFLDSEFRRHPAIAPIINRDPPVFTSSHAPFFL